MPYLDHAATTPTLPVALEAMVEASAVVGNASALHAGGRRARQLVEESRERVAAAVHCLPREVVFTSGGTESDNLAVKGLAWAARAADAGRRRVVTSAIEHHAVLDAAEWLARHEGMEHVAVPVHPEGDLDVAALRAAVERDPGAVALLSVMWANNETGVVQPVADVVAVGREYSIPVHTDAVQALGALPLDFAASGVDAMSLSGHKVGAPIGVGALVIRRELSPEPLAHGGGQERDLRSGTIAMPLIVGFAAAVEAVVHTREEHAARVSALRDRLQQGVLDLGLGAVPHGATRARLPGIAHFTFSGCEGDALLMLLDRAGVQVSTGSACTAGIPQGSHVLLAMGVDEVEARGALRFSLGRGSTAEDVEAVLAALPEAVQRARQAGMMRR